MNLTGNHTKDDLRALLAKCDDESGNHVLWVSKEGEVHIDKLQNGESPIRFEEQHSDTLKFRLETFAVGCGDVGKEAAANDDWVTTLYQTITRLWKEGYQGYCDDFHPTNES